MSISGIQGLLLEVTVVGCNKLKDTEWISRQDPYVCLEYASTKFRTRTCTDGGKNPTFQEKFVFTMIEGLREIIVSVWNSNSLSHDDFIGSGKVQLQDVLYRGFDDRAWPLQTKTGRYAGEVKLILHYANAHKPVTTFAPTAPPYLATPQPHVSMYMAPPPASTYPPNKTSAYPPPPASSFLSNQTSGYPTSNAYPPPATTYPPPPKSYPSTTSSYPYPPYPYPPPHDQPAYPPAAYPPPHDQTGYPPAAYPPPHDQPGYPPAVYPPPHSAYPPCAHAPPYSYSGHYPGVYPPPPH